MERYQRAEMVRPEYLEKMGSVTLKATHAMGKTCLVVGEDDGELHAALQQDQTLDDSLSETRPLPNPDYASSDSDCIEQEDPFLERQKKTNKRAYIAPILKVRLRDLGLTITL